MINNVEIHVGDIVNVPFMEEHKFVKAVVLKCSYGDYIASCVHDGERSEEFLLFGEGMLFTVYRIHYFDYRYNAISHETDTVDIVDKIEGINILANIENIDINDIKINK